MINRPLLSSFEYSLKFKKPARTSRNTYDSRKIVIVQASMAGKKGYGEAGPLFGLSPDFRDDFTEKVNETIEQFNSGVSFNELDFNVFPAAKFGVETALLDLKNGGGGILFPEVVKKQALSIPVNGLVWMDNTEAMLLEALRLADGGYDCIKFKIGALDFDAECRMLESFRKRFPASKCLIRLDANGAFAESDAKEALRELSRFEPHSIEQPLKPNQWDAMAELSAKNDIAIALDEELIGQNPQNAGFLLREIRPQYLVLKPTLLGGLAKTQEWIAAAEASGIGWWVTSALESNIGLNAIAWFTARLQPSLHQGLGTGTLYSNNFFTSHKVDRGSLMLSTTFPFIIPEVKLDHG